jgi:hypothetical protein
MNAWVKRNAAGIIFIGFVAFILEFGLSQCVFMPAKLRNGVIKKMDECIIQAQTIEDETKENINTLFHQYGDFKNEYCNRDQRNTSCGVDNFCPCNDTWFEAENKT